jgi:hypothetical protein
MPIRPTDELYVDRTGRTLYPEMVEIAIKLLESAGKFNPALVTAAQVAYTKAYVRWLYSFNSRLPRPYDFWILFFQWWHETDGGISWYFTHDGNPAGIGIWETGVPSPWIGKLSPEESAGVHIVEFAAHVERLPFDVPDYLEFAVVRDKEHLDKLIDLREKVTWPNVRTLYDLREKVGQYDFVWAADQQYATKISNLSAALYPKLPNARNSDGPIDSGGDTVAYGNRPLRIAVGAGHRNSSGGNEFETSLTALVTNEFVKLAETSDGFDVRCYTPNDGLGWFPGPLDAAAAQVRDWLYNDGWQADILHEIHFEGVGNNVTRGGHVIYPDSAGLIGRNPGNRDVDVMEFGGEMARIMVNEYGGVCRYSECSQAMSEKVTGVGEQGFRLGVFGAWSEPAFNAQSMQLISEGATYTNAADLALMRKPSFPKVHALGLLKMDAALAVERGKWSYPYKIGTVSAPPPPPPVKNPAPDGKPYPAGLDTGILAMAFGDFTGPGNPNDKLREKYRYRFTATGSISKAYYLYYKSKGVFPAVVASFVDGKRWYIFFSDGNIMWRPSMKAGWSFTR